MLDRWLIKHGFGKCLSATPAKRLRKMHWLDVHKNHVHQLIYSHLDNIIINDLIAAGLSRYCNIWETFLKESLNFDIGDNRTQHILWRVRRLPVPSHLKYVIIQWDTNKIVRIVPVKLWMAYYALPYYSKKETLFSK